MTANHKPDMPSPQSDMAWQCLADELAARPWLRIWWRDDDAAFIHPLHAVLRLVARHRLEAMLDVLERYRMPTLVAVVPYKFLNGARPIARLLAQRGAPVAVHGLRHRSRLPGGANEFPPGLDDERQCALILQAHRELAMVYGPKALPVFVPPYNTMSPALACLLEAQGLVISARNPDPCAPESNDRHVDYDFVDWRARRLLPHDRILRDLTRLVRSGRRSLGLNGHHKLITRRDRAFFARLFACIDQCRGAQTDLPFPAAPFIAG